jgi:hypothetical protein
MREETEVMTTTEPTGDTHTPEEDAAVERVLDALPSDLDVYEASKVAIVVRVELRAARQAAEARVETLEGNVDERVDRICGAAGYLTKGIARAARAAQWRVDEKEIEKFTEVVRRELRAEAPPPVEMISDTPSAALTAEEEAG